MAAAKHNKYFFKKDFLGKIVMRTYDLSLVQQIMRKITYLTHLLPMESFSTP